jgi:hypothetical protein
VVNVAEEAAKKAQIAEMFAARQAEREAAEAVERASLSKGEAFSNPPRLEAEPIPEAPPLKSADIMPDEAGMVPYNQEAKAASDLVDVGNVPKERALVTTEKPGISPESEVDINQWGREHQPYTEPSEIPYKATEVAPTLTKEQIVENLSSKDPSKLQDMFDWLKGNKGKVAAGGAAAAGAAGLYVMSQPGDQAKVKGPISKGVDPTGPSAPIADKVQPEEPKKADVTGTTTVEPEKTVGNKIDEVLPGKTLDFGTNNVASQANLQEVQDKANNIRMMSGIMQGVEKMGMGLSAIGSGGRSMTNIDSKDFYAGMNKQADQLMTNYSAKVAMEKKDPNSGYSQGMRQYAKDAFGYNIKGDISGEDLEKGPLKMIADKYKQDQLDKQHRDLKEMQLKQMSERAALSAETKKSAAEDKKSQHQKDQDTKRLDTLNYKITSAMGSSRSAFGQAARNAQSVDNAKALLEGTLDYNTLDNRQVYELAKTLDRVLSQGTATISGTKELTPDTARGWMAKKMEFIGSFVNTIADTLDREEVKAKQQIKAAQSEVLGGMQDLKEHPRFGEILGAHGLDATIFEKKSEEEPKKELPRAQKSTAGTPASVQKKVVKKGYNASTDQTQLIYDDGTKEIVQGRK